MSDYDLFHVLELHYIEHKIQEKNHEEEYIFDLLSVHRHIKQ